MILAACALLTVALLAYVFVLPTETVAAPAKGRLAYLRERKEVIYENLRDLNFEHKAGKFTEADFLAMRTAMEDEAAALLKEMEALERKPAEGAISGMTS